MDYRHHPLVKVLELVVGEGDIDGVKKILEHGLDLCGGPSGGVDALAKAAHGGHVGIMAVLSEHGVKDSGRALLCAIDSRQKDSIMFLLEQYDRDSLDYVKRRMGMVSSLLFFIIKSRNDFVHFAPKLVRWVIDRARPEGDFRRPTVSFQPIGTAQIEVASTLVGAREGGEQTLRAISRLLKQAKAVHAVSLLWPRVVWLGPGKKKKAQAPSVSIVRRTRLGTSRVVLGGLFRYARKKDLR